MVMFSLCFIETIIWMRIINNKILIDYNPKREIKAKKSQKIRNSKALD